MKPKKTLRESLSEPYPTPSGVVLLLTLFGYGAGRYAGETTADPLPLLSAGFALACLGILVGWIFVVRIRKRRAQPEVS